MPLMRAPVAARAVLGAALAGAALFLRLALDGVLQESHIFLTFYPAVLLAAFLLGFWSGITCTLLSALLVASFLLAPAGPGLQDEANLLALAVFTVVGALLSAVAARAADARGNADALGRTQEQLRLVTDATPALISYIDKDRRYRLANRQYETWFGLKRQDVVGRTMAEVLGKAAAERLRPHAERAISGEPVHFEMEVPYRTGGARWIDAHYVPDRDSAGLVRGFFVLVLDITERKKTEHELMQSRTLLDASFNSAGVGKAMCDAVSGRFLRVNRRFCEITGYSEQELLSISPMELAHPDEDPERARQVRELLEGRCDTIALDRWYRRKDGAKIWTQINVVLIRDEHGRPHRTYAIVQDETARRTAEAELRQSNEHLRRAQEAACLGTWDWDLASGAVHWSEGIFRLLGLEPDSIEPGMERWRALVLAEDLPAVDRALDRGREGDGPFNFEFRIRRRDGAIRWVASIGRVEKDQRGRATTMRGVSIDITERKAVEAERQRLSEQRQLALRAANLGWWHYDPVTGSTIRDGRFNEIFGLKGTEGPIKDAFGRIHPEDRSRVQEAIDAALDPLNPRPYSLQYRILRPDGLRWVETHGLASFEGEGATRRAMSLAGTVEDITDRMAAEELRHEAEQRLLLAKEAAGLGIHDFDITTGRIKWDDQTRRLWGVPPDEPITFDTYRAGLHPADQESARAAVDRAMDPAGDGRYFDEYRIINRIDGCTRWVQATGIVTFEHRRAVRLVGTVQDITDRKTAETMIRASEARFRTLADAMPQLVWTAEPDGGIEYYNRKVAQFEGILFDDESGTWDWKAALHPDDVDRTARAWAEAIATGGEYLIEHRMLMRCPAEDGRGKGEYRWHLSRGIPVRNSEGRITKWYGTATDIQAIKQSEEALRRANDDLLQFASIASHDLKEPLRGMSLLASFIEEDDNGALSEASRAKLARIRELGDRLTRMVSSLLEHARTGLNPVLTPCDLGEVVQRIIDTSREDHAARGCEVELRGPLPTVLADPMLMERVFFNLIGNGLKFNTSPRKRVEIFASDGLVAVRDNGIGIEPHHHEKIFRIFRRAHGSDRYPGDGLGLAIVRKIIEAHGGTIRVESSPGAGSTFWITLPPAPTAASLIEVQQLKSDDDDGARSRLNALRA